MLKINKKNNNENNLLILATRINNIEIVKLLIEYANKNKIILELNDKDIQGHNPLI